MEEREMTKKMISQKEAAPWKRVVKYTRKHDVWVVLGLLVLASWRRVDSRWKDGSTEFDTIHPQMRQPRHADGIY